MAKRNKDSKQTPNNGVVIGSDDSKSVINKVSNFSIKSRAIFVLDNASLKTGLVRKKRKILSACEDAVFLSRQGKNLNDYRPTIFFEALRAILDSPLNQAGMVGAVYVKTDSGVVFEVKPHTRIPRTFRRFCGILLELLEKSCVRAKDSGETLIRVLKEPLTRIIPENARVIGLSYSSEKVVDVEDYLSAASDDSDLVFVIQSMSRKALASSIEDIFSAVYAADKLPEVTNDKYNDREDVNAYCSGPMDNNSDGHAPQNKLKRNISCTTGDRLRSRDNEDCMQSSSGNSDSAATSSMKRPKIESNHDLLVEIRKTNEELIESVLEVVSDSVEANYLEAPSDGTIVRCTYTPVAVCESFRTRFASAISLEALPVEFLVPSDYPNSPPQILDTLPRECSKQSEDLMEKAKNGFTRRIRGLSQLASVGTMARVWNESARSAFLDLASCFGGETFSSKHGSWECVSAA